MKARQSRGFTLIEMVVAFAILSLTLTALYGSFESALSRSRRDAHLSEATLVAQSLLSRMGSEWPLDAGSLSGNWEGYHYEVEAQPVTVAQGQPHPTLPMMEVTASVAWGEGANPRRISISTLKLLPQVGR